MSDWDKVPPGMKVPFTLKVALQIHAACGGYLAIMEAFKQAVPQSDYEATLPQIQDQFKLGYLDSDITHFLESSVPPVNLQSVNFVRTGSVRAFDIRLLMTCLSTTSCMDFIFGCVRQAQKFRWMFADQICLSRFEFVLQHHCCLVCEAAGIF